MNPFAIVAGIGSVLKFVLKPAIALVNKAPKDTLTGLGGIIGIAGAAAGVVSPHIVTAENIVPILKAACEIVTAIGGIMVAMGAQRAHKA